MMHMYYPLYNNLYSFKGESSFDFTFQQQQNWNLYNQLAINPFIIDNGYRYNNNNNNAINLFQPIDLQYQNSEIYNNNNKRIKSNHIYSKFTIPSITSIISPQPQLQPTITITNNNNSNNNNNSINNNTTNFLSSLSNSNNNDLSSSLIIPQISPTELDFNYNENLIQSSSSSSTTTTTTTSSSSSLSSSSSPSSPSSPSSSSSSNSSSSSLSSYFSTPDNDTTISLQDIIDGMNVMHEISKDLSNYNNNNDNDLLAADFNDNSIDWFIQENWNDINEVDEVQKKTRNVFQYVDDLIEEHMKEIKKVVHNEILCQELLTESSNLDYQDLSFKNLTVETTSQIDDGSYNQGGIITNQESSSSSSSSSDIFESQENDFSYTIGEASTSTTSSTSSVNSTDSINSTDLINPTDLIKSQGCTSTVDQRTYKCNEVGCSKEYNCYAKLKSHKVIHTGDKPFTCNFLGCNKKFKRSGELIKHQLDHLN